MICRKRECQNSIRGSPLDRQMYQLCYEGSQFLLPQPPGFPRYLCFFLIRLPCLLNTDLNCGIVVRKLQIPDQHTSWWSHWGWDRMNSLWEHRSMLSTLMCMDAFNRQSPAKPQDWVAEEASRTILDHTGTELSHHQDKESSEFAPKEANRTRL